MNLLVTFTANLVELDPMLWRIGGQQIFFLKIMNNKVKVSSTNKNEFDYIK